MCISTYNARLVYNHHQHSQLMSLFLVIYNAIRVYKSLQLTSSLTLLTLAGAHNAGEANAARTRIQKHGVRLHCDSDE